MFKINLQKFTLFLIFCSGVKLTICRPGTSNDVKNILNSSSAKPSRLQSVQESEQNLFARAAFTNGMDPDIVRKVQRTGKPFVKSETDENGGKRTTTYELEADGSISRRTITEYAPTVIKSHFISAPLENKPYLQNNLSGLSKGIGADWEWNPSNVPQYGISSSHTDNFPRWSTTRNNAVFPSTNPAEGIDETIVLPKTWNTQLWPDLKTETVDVDTSNAGTDTRTFLNDDKTKVTVTHTVGPTKWTTRTFTYPSTNLWPGTDTQITTTNVPDVLRSAEKEVPTQLPTLEEFLKSQYGTSNRNHFSDTRTTTIIPYIYDDKPVTTININDLPILKVSDENNPRFEDTLNIPINSSRNIPTTFKIENIPETNSPEVRTQTTIFSKKIQGSDSPTISDLDDNMKNILEEAGINPDDLLKSKDGSIQKTREEPDGKIVTTTYRVRTIPPPLPHSFAVDVPQGPFPINSVATTPKKHFSASHSGTKFPVFEDNRNLEPHNFFESESEPKPVIFKTKLDSPSTNTRKTTGITKTRESYNPIDEFLKKVDLTPESITALNGELIKTIVDDNGRILTATFVLSSVRNEQNEPEKEIQKYPIK